jgi:RNA-directed DNA polymerase
MTKASIDLQDLRRRLYVKAKAETSWRFWGLYVHICKLETLHAAYVLAQKNDGAPGIDGVTFAAIEGQGVEAFLVQIRDELVRRTYAPLPARRQEIPKDGGKVRILLIPAIRDRVVQGALKLILEPIFEADFQPGSFGYRPKRTAHEAVDRVAKAIVQQKTRVIDIDLRSYLDPVSYCENAGAIIPHGSGRVFRLRRSKNPAADGPLPRIGEGRGDEERGAIWTGALCGPD